MPDAGRYAVRLPQAYHPGMTVRRSMRVKAIVPSRRGALLGHAAAAGCAAGGVRVLPGD